MRCHLKQTKLLLIRKRRKKKRKTGSQSQPDCFYVRTNIFIITYEQRFVDCSTCDCRILCSAEIQKRKEKKNGGTNHVMDLNNYHSSKC